MVDLVRSGRPNEDARVELKADWPDPLKAARRLAAHANTARGEAIFWIIGLDQATGKAEVRVEELANWFPQVEKQFDGIAPSVIDLVVPVEGGVVVALYFETTRAPFVVRNPVPSGPVTLEVPWREGTRTRSATRADLLRLLVPLQKRPEIEALRGSLSAELISDERDESRNVWAWNAYVTIYIVPATVERIVMPCHTAGLAITGLSGSEIPSYDVRLHAPQSYYGMRGSVPASVTIETTPYEAIVDGPGVLEICGEASSPASTEDVLPDTLGIRLELMSLHSDQPGVLELLFERADRIPGQPQWTFKAPSSRPSPLFERDGMGRARISPNISSNRAPNEGTAGDRGPGMVSPQE